MEDREALRRFRCLNNKHRSLLQKKLDKYGLFLGQQRILFYLDRHGGTTQKELGINLDIKKESLSNSLTRMEKAGFLYRSLGVEDRRKRLISLSEHGKAIADECRAEILDVNESMFLTFDEEEIAYIETLFIRMYENLSDYENTMKREGIE